MTDHYLIRPATYGDVDSLHRLVELDGGRLFCGPALVGEIDGVVAAAVSLADGRVIADPFRPTESLKQLMHRCREALRPAARSVPPAQAAMSF